MRIPISQIIKKSLFYCTVLTSCLPHFRILLSEALFKYFQFLPSIIYVLDPYQKDLDSQVKCNRFKSLSTKILLVHTIKGRKILNFSNITDTILDFFLLLLVKLSFLIFLKVIGLLAHKDDSKNILADCILTCKSIYGHSLSSSNQSIHCTR